MWHMLCALGLCEYSSGRSGSGGGGGSGGSGSSSGSDSGKRTAERRPMVTTWPVAPMKTTSPPGIVSSHAVHVVPFHAIFRACTFGAFGGQEAAAAAPW